MCIRDSAIRTATSVSLERSQIQMDEHVKELGSFTASATLFDGVIATVNYTVIAK